MAKSKSAKKKNQVSKHILKSREDADATSTETGPGDIANANAVKNSNSASSKAATSSKKKKSKKNRNIKHPEEASSYLTQWKASKSSEDPTRTASSWKFNKNTQSWLIRHMYEVEKVSKSSFFLLMEYLEGLEGSTIKDRMRSEASRRCRRHKEYCKNNPTTTEDNNDKTETTTEKGNNNENNDELEAEKPASTSKTATATTTTTTSAEDKAELEYEEALWKKMDDHEKRKQYKRARKILDLVKEKE